MLFFDRTLELVVKSVYFATRNFIIFVGINLWFNLYYEPKFLLEISVLYYAFSFFICEKLLHIKNKNPKVIKLIITIFFIISISLDIVCFNNTSIYMYIIGFLYFLFIFFNSFTNNTQYPEASSEIKKGIITVIVMIFIVSFISVGNNISNINLNVYIMIYFLSGVVYIARSNFSKEYNMNNYDVINKKKNMMSFNIITLIMMVVLFFSRSGVYSFIKILANIVIQILSYFKFILDGILWIVASILEYIINWIIMLVQMYTQDTPEQTMEIGESENIFENTATNQDFHKYAEIILKVIFIIVTIIIIIVIINKIYKYIMQYLQKNKNDGDDEEKEFIFNKNDILNNIKNKIRNFRNKEKEMLNPIRKKYKDIVNKLISHGYRYEKNMTPKEYINNIPEETSNELGFMEITNSYNDNRYGKEK